MNQSKGLTQNQEKNMHNFKLPTSLTYLST
jgi:hypothetical protein